MRPYVVIYVTASVDGKIAAVGGYSKFSCIYDLRRLHKLRASVDAVLVGANTVINDNPLLTVRYVPGRNPVRVIIDGLLKIPENARIVEDRSAKTIIFTTRNADKDKVLRLMSKGVNVVVINTSDNHINPNYLLRELSLRGIRTLLVEGGGETIWNFIKYGVFDEFRITLSPYIVGGRKATPIVGGEGFKNVFDFTNLTLKNIEPCECGNEVHLVYHRVPTGRVLFS